MPKIHLVFDAFFMGLIAFKMYRDGEGEEHLDKGKKALDKMKILSNCSTANFGNKLLLLEAEHQASMCNIHAANVAFEESVRSARDHGLVHEQGEHNSMNGTPNFRVLANFRIFNSFHQKVLHVSCMVNSCLL